MKVRDECYKKFQTKNTYWAWDEYKVLCIMLLVKPR